MAEKRGDLLEGTFELELREGEQGRWLFVPPGYPLIAPWLAYLQENPVEYWRLWWDRWYLPRCTCCCCNDEPTRGAAATLAVDLHLNHVFYFQGAGGAAQYNGAEIHIGWAVTGATAQVSVNLEWKLEGQPYRSLGTFQGATMADYQFPPPLGRARPILVYANQTYWFKAVASDTRSTVASELPVHT